VIALDRAASEAADSDSDEALLERTRRGDAGAFAALAIRYWEAIHRVARNMLPDAPAPARIGEATFRSLLRSADAFPRGVRWHRDARANGLLDRAVASAATTGQRSVGGGGLETTKGRLI
jgi:hypothetical protein